MKIISVERGLDKFMLPLPSVVLRAGDHLVLQDTPDRLKAGDVLLVQGPREKNRRS